MSEYWLLCDSVYLVLISYIVWMAEWLALELEMFHFQVQLVCEVLL